MQEDPYAILGVKNTATQAEIQAAYKRKARELHPDVNKAPGAEEQFRRLVDAYDILRDEEKRARYDNAARRPYTRPSSSSRPRRPQSRHKSGLGFEDITTGRDDYRSPVEEFLRKERQRRRNNPSNKKEREVHLSIPLEHAYEGTTLTMSVEIPDHKGAKQLHSLKLKVPQGAKNGDRLKLSNPDIVVVLKLEAPEGVEVDGRDVKIHLPISPWEAALGAEVSASTPKGPISLKIPAGTCSGQKLRLRGQGIPPKPGRDGTPGDLFVKIQIAVPSVLDEDERELFEKLREISRFDPRKN